MTCLGMKFPLPFLKISLFTCCNGKLFSCGSGNLAILAVMLDPELRDATTEVLGL